MTPIRTLVMDRLVEILGRISRANAAEGFVHDVTPERVRRGRRIMPDDPPPCISVFCGLEQPEAPGDGTPAHPRSVGKFYAELSASIAFKTNLDEEPEGTDQETAADAFIADVQLAMGIAARATGSESFSLQMPKYPSGALSDQTVWWREVGVMAFVSQTEPRDVYGQVDYLFWYPRSLFHPGMA